jgi:hypothetical protein
MTGLLDDIAWAAQMFRARRHRRKLYFSGRVAFDKAVRPKLDEGRVIDYPDAIYHAEVDDFRRALAASSVTPAR